LKIVDNRMDNFDAEAPEKSIAEGSAGWRRCPAQHCPATPYITTAPDHTVANNLDNLLHC